jgi:diguanylate cyclase (GGDEF)-like protein
MVILLLLAVIGSFAITFPALSGTGQRVAGASLNNAVRGLAGIVLLFIVYAVYQQTLIKKMRTRMVMHLGMLVRTKSQADEFRTLATVDPLTGLHNRRNAEQLLASEMARAQRYNHPLAVLMLDLDGFKQINDRHGHAAGDIVLREFSSRLRSAIRGSDTAMRMGGDEFLVLLPGTRPEEVRHLLRRLERVSVTLGQTAIEVTFSAGWAGCVAGETPAQILERADRALYAEKRGEKRSPPLLVP